MYKEFTEKEKVEIIKNIKKSIDAEKVYQGEICFLLENTDIIKKHFTNDPILWQWADIPEEEYINK